MFAQSASYCVHIRDFWVCAFICAPLPGFKAQSKGGNNGGSVQDCCQSNLIKLNPNHKKAEQLISKDVEVKDDYLVENTCVRRDQNWRNILF